MSANYWDSTHRRHWLFTKEELAEMRGKLADRHADLVQMFPLPSQRHLGIYFNLQLNRLAKRLDIQQQVVATAQVYIKRFLSRIELRRANPHLILTAALYLACKMEESPQPIRNFVTHACSLWPDQSAALDTSRLGECEFFLISEMNSQLIVHQPYRTVVSLQHEFGMSTDDVNIAWGVVNDHYMTDLPLLAAPHIVALTAVLLAVVVARPSGNTSTGTLGASAGAGAGVGAAAAPPAPVPGVNSASPKVPVYGSAGDGGDSGSGGVPIATAVAFGASQTGMATPGNGSAVGALQGVFSSGPGTAGLLGQLNVAPAQDEAANKRPAKEADARISKAQRFSMFLAESSVNIAAVIECTQEMISFYEGYDQYNDKQTREQISRLIKARGLDKLVSG